MTKKEAAVIEIYTGTVMLIGADRKLVHDYVEELMNRTVYIHEYPELADVLKEKSEPDFIKICESLS